MIVRSLIFTVIDISSQMGTNYEKVFPSTSHISPSLFLSVTIYLMSIALPLTDCDDGVWVFNVYQNKFFLVWFFWCGHKTIPNLFHVCMCVSSFEYHLLIPQNLFSFNRFVVIFQSLYDEVLVNDIFYWTFFFFIFQIWPSRSHYIVASYCLVFIDMLLLSFHFHLFLLISFI